MSQKTIFGTSEVDFCRKNLPKSEIVPKLISSGKCVKNYFLGNFGNSPGNQTKK